MNDAPNTFFLVLALIGAALYTPPQTKTGETWKKITVKEVAQHNTSADCWVIIGQGVYDVTKFIPRHPGGPLIYVNAGGDCTQMFESYHPPSARLVLDKFRIGDVDLGENKSSSKASYTRKGEEFYRVSAFKLEGILGSYE